MCCSTSWSICRMASSFNYQSYFTFDLRCAEWKLHYINEGYTADTELKRKWAYTYTHIQYKKYLFENPMYSCDLNLNTKWITCVPLWSWHVHPIQGFCMRKKTAMCEWIRNRIQDTGFISCSILRGQMNRCVDVAAFSIFRPSVSV